MPDIIRCITIRQPWAHLIVTGHKDVENRTWSTKHRGELAIHAGLSWDEAGEEFARARGIDVGPRHRLRVGAVIGVVDLVDVAPSASPWALPNHEHWKLERPRLLDAFGAVGRQGLWSVTIPDGCRLPRMRCPTCGVEGDNTAPRNMRNETALCPVCAMNGIRSACERVAEAHR